MMLWRFAGAVLVGAAFSLAAWLGYEQATAGKSLVDGLALFWAGLVVSALAVEVSIERLTRR